MSGTVFGPVLLATLYVPVFACALTSPLAQNAAGHSSPNPGAATHSAAAPAMKQDQELRQEIAQQQAALVSGDPGAIESASKALVARALRDLAQVKIVRGASSEGIALFRQSLAFAPSVDGRLELASALLRAGDANAAADEALTATEMDPGNAAAWAVRGGALRAGKREKDAVVAFEQSMRLRPMPDVAYALGSTLLQLHEEAKADVVFAQILKASDNAAIWYVEIGDAYRGAEYLPEAVTAFQQAIRRDPRVSHGEFFLGLTYLQMNQWGPNSESFRHLREAVRLAPKEYVSNFYLGALESTDGSDLASSDQHLRAAAAADGTQPEVWLYLGLNANRQHRTEEAKAALRKAIELTGKDESRNNYQVRRAYFALGRILVNEGQRDEGAKLLAKYSAAEQAAVAQSGASIRDRVAVGSETPATAGMYGAALTPSMGDTAAVREVTATRPKLQPDQERALSARDAALRHVLATSGNDLGTAEAREQRYAEALATFTEAAQWETPSMPALLRNEGTAAFRVGRYEEAAAALSRYFERQGSKAEAGAGDDRARIMLAMSEFSTGHFREASTAFATAGPAAMADPRAAYSWAYSLAHTGQAQEANRLATELAARDLPIEQRMLVCHVFVDTENYEGSADCYRRAYAQDPTVRLAHYEVGEALVRLDRAAEAVPELRAELQLSPDDANVQYALAYALLQLSQKEEAQRLLEQIAVGHPEQAEAQYQLGKLLLEQGKLPEAIGHLESSEQASAAAPGGTPDYVHYQLGNAYRKAGRSADAEKELTLYREIKDRKRAGATSRE